MEFSVIAKLRLIVGLMPLWLAAACGPDTIQSSFDDKVGGVFPPSANPSPAPGPGPSPTPTHTIPQAGYILAKSIAGAEDVAANFDIDLGLQPSWGTGGIPGSYGFDEGAFRFVCGGDGKLAKDDPVVFFEKAGASHLHQVWGNELFDSRTTPAALAQSAETNCNATPYSLNRSSYWMPALVHESGDVIKPDLVVVYYKRKMASSSYCNPSSPKFIGTCVGIPNQIRFIFGWDATRPTATVKGASWYCTTGDGKHYANLDDLFNSGCTVGADIYANTMAPNCWDGKHLDSPDHRSHMAYMEADPATGAGRCPSTHPYLIPQEENKAQFHVTSDMVGTRSDGSKYSRVRLTSDGMLPGAKPGATLHADYMEAWITAGKNLWMDHCINRGLDCSGGDLGNGKQLIGAAQPKYGWRNPASRVPWQGN